MTVKIYYNGVYIACVLPTGVPIFFTIQEGATVTWCSCQRFPWSALWRLKNRDILLPPNLYVDPQFNTLAWDGYYHKIEV